MIESFNNKTDKVGDDLKESITKGSSIDVAAGIFSIYGFSSLKKEFSKKKIHPCFGFDKQDKHVLVYI